MVGKEKISVYFIELSTNVTQKFNWFLTFFCSWFGKKNIIVQKIEFQPTIPLLFKNALFKWLVPCLPNVHAILLTVSMAGLLVGWLLFNNVKSLTSDTSGLDVNRSHLPILVSFQRQATLKWLTSFVWGVSNKL